MVPSWPGSALTNRTVGTSFTSSGLSLPVCGGWACSDVSKETTALAVEELADVLPLGI